VYRRRSDIESINRVLDDTMWLGRAHSRGHQRQLVNLLGFALMTNGLAVHLHRKRTAARPDSNSALGEALAATANPSLSGGAFARPSSSQNELGMDLGLAVARRQLILPTIGPQAGKELPGQGFLSYSLHAPPGWGQRHELKDQ